MMKHTIVAVLALAVFATAPALAQCSGDKAQKNDASCQVKCDKDKKSCCSKDDAKACCSKDGKPAQCDKDKNCVCETVAARGMKLPKMVYDVNGERLCCAETAAKLATEKQVEIKYVVGETVYTDKAEAMGAQAEVLNKFLDNALTISYAVGDKCVGCPDAAAAMAKSEDKPMHFRVASFDYADRESAERAIERAKDASKKVEMTMMVGDNSFCCPTGAAQASKSTGKSIEYCVGETKTCEKPIAEYELAVARINAAFAALSETDGKQVAGA